MTQHFTPAAANDYTLEMLGRIQENILEATKAHVAALNRLMPERPTAPKADDLPTIKELLEETFDFRARMLDADKAFSLKLVDAWVQVAQGGAPDAVAPEAAASKK